MKTTNYICDICKTSKKSRRFMSNASNYEWIKKIKEGSYYTELNVDICKDCLEKRICYKSKARTNRR